MQRTDKAATPAVTNPEQLAGKHEIDLGHELTNGFAAHYIRRKAKQLVRRAGFSRSDVDDIQQQLFQRLLENLAAFDPEQGHFNVFVKTLVERYVANILRDSRAEKRDRRQTCSLSTVVEEFDGGPVELGDTISQHELDARLGRETRDAADLVMDVSQIAAGLPDDLRDLYERLKYGTVSEVARNLGVPRTTVHDRVKRLRRHFDDAGLRNYP